MIEKSIANFMKKQLEEQKRAKRKERKQVCIKPDSYIGREIQYQTALLHEISEEIRKSKGSKKITFEVLQECPSCKKSISIGANFCPYCGKKVKDECNYCWVRKEHNYDCGEHNCRGWVYLE